MYDLYRAGQYWAHEDHAKIGSHYLSLSWYSDVLLVAGWIVGFWYELFYALIACFIDNAPWYRERQSSPSINPTWSPGAIGYWHVDTRYEISNQAEVFPLASHGSYRFLHSLGGNDFLEVCFSLVTFTMAAFHNCLVVCRKTQVVKSRFLRMKSGPSEWGTPRLL
jgi:hypothetical protein